VNYYQHHIGDFNNATRHLTRLEKSIYRDLIELYYDTEMPLQCDRNALARKILVIGPEELTAMDAVLDEFFTLEGENWHHERCDLELSKIYEKSDRARVSAEKRWAKHNKKKAKNADAMRTHSEGNATQDPITQVTTTTARPTIDEISAYVETRTIKIDPSTFLDYYTANGWKVGRNPLKDWKAAVRNWEKRERQSPNTSPRSRDTSLAQDLTDTSWAQSTRPKDLALEDHITDKSWAN
jgi:uncharacterized protein YdaU (DUF1376 family)